MRLLESKPDKKKRSLGGTIVSIVLHSAILFLAVFATARAGVRHIERTKAEKVTFVAPKKDEPPPPPKKELPPPPKKVETPKPKTPAPPKVVEVPKVAAPAPPQGFKVVA